MGSSNLRFRWFGDHYLGPTYGRLNIGRLRRHALRSLGGGGGNCWGGLMARPRRLECHAPMQFTVRTIRNLRRTAEVEIRVPRFADRPAAVVLLKVEKLLWS
jgi:hypothetical protein